MELESTTSASHWLGELRATIAPPDHDSTLVSNRKSKFIFSKTKFTPVVLPFDCKILVCKTLNCKTWDVYEQNCKMILAVYLSTYKTLYISFLLCQPATDGINNICSQYHHIAGEIRLLNKKTFPPTGRVHTELAANEALRNSDDMSSPLPSIRLGHHINDPSDGIPTSMSQ